MNHKIAHGLNFVENYLFAQIMLIIWQLEGVQFSNMIKL